MDCIGKNTEQAIYCGTNESILCRNQVVKLTSPNEMISPAFLTAFKCLRFSHFKVRPLSHYNHYFIL
ncbi:unnamed protein product [Larinioides sclopetarius]|uniref:Uncharacterized protein n=1 Tax=Larinioides sclopetarius TaxID=280406 RepID=A0AAV1YR39_9ARAC